jgi:hypothetical protein
MRMEGTAAPGGSQRARGGDQGVLLGVGLTLVFETWWALSLRNQVWFKLHPPGALGSLTR